MPTLFLKQKPTTDETQEMRDLSSNTNRTSPATITASVAGIVMSDDKVDRNRAKKMLTNLFKSAYARAGGRNSQPNEAIEQTIIRVSEAYMSQLSSREHNRGFHRFTAKLAMLKLPSRKSLSVFLDIFNSPADRTAVQELLQKVSNDDERTNAINAIIDIFGEQYAKELKTLSSSQATC